MKFWLKKNIYLLPIILLGVDLLSIFVKLDFVVAGNIAGYSLITNILFFYVFYYGKYCWLTRLSPIGLCAINIINIIGGYISNTFYSFWYTLCVFFITITFSIIFEIIKRTKND